MYLKPTVGDFSGQILQTCMEDFPFLITSLNS